MVQALKEREHMIYMYRIHKIIVMNHNNEAIYSAIATYMHVLTHEIL